MLTRLSEGVTKRTATDGRAWSHEAVEALLQLLVKMRADVNIITPQGDGTYRCDLASLFDPAKRGRHTQVNVLSGEYRTGILRDAYWERHAADNDVQIGMNFVDYYSLRDPITSAKITLSPQTLVEVKFANWSSSRRFTKDEIAEAVRVFSREYSEESGWSMSSTGTAPWPPAFSAISYKPYDPPATTAGSTPWSPALTSALSSGIGAKTVEGGMVPPSVYKGPPAEPKPKKKWWKR